MEPIDRLVKEMGMYNGYHRHPVNRAIHLVCIPLIVWGLQVLLARVDLFTFADFTVTLATLATGLLLMYYVWMDLGLGIPAVLFLTFLLATAHQVAALGWTEAGIVFAASWVVGWGFQFLGHGVWEKRRPALMDNLTQVFIAPIFLIAEIAFSLGRRKDLHARVEAEAAKFATT